jgi:hypothetical protein
MATKIKSESDKVKDLLAGDVINEQIGDAYHLLIAG